MSLSISPAAIYNNNQQSNNVAKINGNEPNFKGNDNDKQYYNPIDKSTEKLIAGINSGVWGTIVGTVAGLAVGAGSGSKKAGIISGVLGGLATFGLMLVSKIYNANVAATMKEKQMDVFVRERSAAANIAEKLDQQVNDDENIDNVVNNYAKVRMADKSGGGVLLMNA